MWRAPTATSARLAATPYRVDAAAAGERPDRLCPGAGARRRALHQGPARARRCRTRGRGCRQRRLERRLRHAHVLHQRPTPLRRLRHRHPLGGCTRRRSTGNPDDYDQRLSAHRAGQPLHSSTSLMIGAVASCSRSRSASSRASRWVANPSGCLPTIVPLALNTYHLCLPSRSSEAGTDRDPDVGVHRHSSHDYFCEDGAVRSARHARRLRWDGRTGRRRWRGAGSAARGSDTTSIRSWWCPSRQGERPPRRRSGRTPAVLFVDLARCARSRREAPPTSPAVLDPAARGKRLLAEPLGLGRGVGVVAGVADDVVARPEAERDDLVRVRLLCHGSASSAAPAGPRNG